MRIAIEGLIGIGKSTALSMLEGQYRVAYEPLESWTLLPQFYANKKKFGAVFEAQVLCSFALESFQYGNASNETLLMERSPESALHVFARMLLTNGEISNENYELLQRMYQQWPIAKADAFIFLDGEPDMCLKRILERERVSETNSIQVSFLKALREAYISFFTKQEKTFLLLHVEPEEKPHQIASRIVSAIETLKHENDK